MATEDDKTNTGVAGTAIAVGVAAMIAGSSALVGMARTQVDEVSGDTQAYADLSSVRALSSEHGAKLTSAKVSIDKARQITLSALKRDPDQASPWTPKPPPPEPSVTAEAGSTAASTEAVASVTGETSAAPSAATTALVTRPEGSAPTAEATSGAAPAPVGSH